MKRKLILLLCELNNYSNKLNHEQSAGQTNLFYSESDEDQNLPELRRAKELQVDEKLGFEYATLGFYFSGHPFDAYRNDCKHFTRYNISSLIFSRIISNKFNNPIFSESHKYLQ